MATLKFKNSDLQLVIAHTMKSTQFCNSLEQQVLLYQQKTKKRWHPSVELGEEYRYSTVPSLFLVKDTGIYVMTTAKMDKIPADMSHVAYAVGYDPKTPDVWEKSRDAVGGDDFAEQFELTPEIIHHVMKHRADMVIKFSRRSMEVYLIAGK